MLALFTFAFGLKDLPLPLQEIGIDHLHIPTVDYLYAPPLDDLHRGVAFIAGEGRPAAKVLLPSLAL